MVNLTSAGSSGSILGAQFVQSTSGAGGTGVIQSFVRINPTGQATTEQGYNTSSRPVQFDENNSPNFTRSFQLGDVAEVAINGVPYYEFLLDINQSNTGSGTELLSLDQLRLYVSPTNINTSANNFANGYNSATGTLGGLSPSYDMNPDLSSTNFVELNGGLKPGSGAIDMTLFVPVSALGTNPNSWIYLYSAFGGHTFTSDQGNTGGAANDGFEEWVNTTVHTPTISTTVSPPSTVVLGSGVKLNDTATLVGGVNPTGTITFTLMGPNNSVVYTDVVTVTGNGTYNTSTMGNNAGGFLPTAPGTYHWVASYSGDLSNSPVASNPDDEPQTVVKASPTITTNAGPTVVLGSGVPLTDSATLAGGFDPTGTITFTLMNPSNSVVYTDVVTIGVNSDGVTGNGTYDTSMGDNPGGFLPTVPGTYHWVASYSGDTNDNPVASNPDDEPQQVTAAGAFITLVGSGVLRGSSDNLNDTAILTGGTAPFGTITFYLFLPGDMPNDPTNPTNFVYRDVVTATGNGIYNTSTMGDKPGGFAPTVAGIYHWVAHYTGDGTVPATTTAFDDEPQTVLPATPTITTNAGPTVVLGSGVPLTDSATLAGGFDPTGTITFTLMNPSNSVVYTDVVTIGVNSDGVTGNGTYDTSMGDNPGGFLPTVPGTYHWVASYGGDTNNDPVASNPDDEPQTVLAASPTITTNAGPTVVLGSGVPLTDSATLAGGFDPTGTITFTLFVPGGGPVETDVVQVNGNGTYTTPTGFVPTVPGVYQWRARYSGDDDNEPVASDLGDEPETVLPATPTITTNAGPTVVQGSGVPLTDSATLAGGFDPTGTITFTLMNPSNSVVYTDVVTIGVNSDGVTGNGTYDTSMGNNPGGFVPTVPGTYHWVASYSGDTNDNPVASNPGDEPQTVITPSPPIPPTADVMLTKVVSPTNPIFGTPVTYTLIAHNNGPDTATNVVVTDILPTGVVFVSAKPSQGSFDPASGTWIIGTLPNGASATLQITCIVTTIGPITNTSSVKASEPDPDPANNVSSVTIDGMFAPGQISKGMFLSSSDTPLNPATLAAEEALFNALVPLWTNIWDAMLSEAQSLLAARNDPGPGNGGIAVFEGNWLGSPLVVYANLFAGQVTAVQVGAFDFLYENNAVAGVRLL